MHKLLLTSLVFFFLVSFAFAESGLKISKPSASSITLIAFVVWDIGLWPRTSPVAIISIPFLSAYSFAFLNMKTLQSLQGLIPEPVPNCGLFRRSRYSDRRGSLLTSCIIILTNSRSLKEN